MQYIEASALTGYNVNNVSWLYTYMLQYLNIKGVTTLLASLYVHNINNIRTYVYPCLFISLRLCSFAIH